MADELDGLLARVDDPALRTDLRSHIDRIRAKRTFGLVFESHLPERVYLPEHPIRVGVKVVHRHDPYSSTFQVFRISDGRATIRKVRHPDGSTLSAEELDEAMDDAVDTGALVVIADFGEPVYPGLRRLGLVERGGDKPSHVVIKGENHHVLEAMQFTHAGKIDCIYIDPPYNTGARDWKYDNNYVDDSDAYRHSKWLAFMQRRLNLAKELLKPENSVIIVTIDEKEYLRLGLLLEQLFTGSTIQMVSTVIKPGGTSRTKEFSRVEEYIFFVFFGSADVARTGDNMLTAPTNQDAAMSLTESDLWEGMIRRGIGVVRAQRPKQFYPIYIDPEAQRIVDCGEPLHPDTDRSTVPVRQGLTTVWPIKDDGSEGFWQLSPLGLEQARGRGTVRVGTFNSKTRQWRIQYMKAKKAKAVDDGTIATLGKDRNGVVVLDLSGRAFSPESTPRTVWNRQSHDASVGGAGLLNKFLPGRKFPFPKSLYAVEDAIRFFVKDKPDAVVLDFFGGSGTTAHAVARLNRQDAGRRQSIVVTNNEVSADEAASLRKNGLRPGDPEWEALGIFEYITRPRITSAITGKTAEGETVKGDYRFTDEFPLADGFEENVEFAELIYLDSDDIELDLAFAGIAPLLWLRAGARGPILYECPDSGGGHEPYSWTDQYGVLFNPDRWRGFVDKLPATATTAFVVTDSQATFAGVAAELPDRLDVVRLYENYLATFRINEGYS